MMNLYSLTSVYTYWKRRAKSQLYTWQQMIGRTKVHLGILSDQTIDLSSLLHYLATQISGLEITYKNSLSAEPKDAKGILATSDVIILASHHSGALTQSSRLLDGLDPSKFVLFVSDRPLYQHKILLNANRWTQFQTPVIGKEQTILAAILAGFERPVVEGDEIPIYQQELKEDFDSYLRNELITKLLRRGELDPIGQNFHQHYFFSTYKRLHLLIISFGKEDVDRRILETLAHGLEEEMDHIVVRLSFHRLIGIIFAKTSRQVDYEAQVRKAIEARPVPELDLRDLKIRIVHDLDSIDALSDALHEEKRLQQASSYENHLRSKVVLDMYTLEQQFVENVINCDWVKVEAILRVIGDTVDSVNKKNPIMNRAYFCYLWRYLDRIIFQLTNKRKTFSEKDYIDRQLEGVSTIDLMVDLILEFSKLMAIELALDQDSTKNIIVERVKEFVGLHYAEDVSLEHVAKVMGLSSFHLSKMFKKAEQMNFKDYVISVRMWHAKVLLADGMHLVSEVANKVGYQSSNYFSKAFKQFYNISPSEFMGKSS